MPDSFLYDGKTYEVVGLSGRQNFDPSLFCFTTVPEK